MRGVRGRGVASPKHSSSGSQGLQGGAGVKARRGGARGAGGVAGTWQASGRERAHACATPRPCGLLAASVAPVLLLCCNAVERSTHLCCSAATLWKEPLHNARVTEWVGSLAAVSPERKNPVLPTKALPPHSVTPSSAAPTAHHMSTAAQGRHVSTMGWVRQAVDK